MINNVKIANTETTLLESPGGISYTIVSMFLCNTSVNTETITINVIKSGDSATDTNTILKEVSITAADTAIFSEKILLESLDKVVAIGTLGNSVSCTVSFITM